MLKRIISYITAFMVVTAISAYAEADAKTVYDTLGKYGIMTGDENGNLRADEEVTRAEMARMIVSVLGYKEADGFCENFSDVKSTHWASGYIKKAYELGIIAGMGDGRFCPDDKVTNEQAVKMIVCALGYEPLSEMRGGYPLGYMHIAGTKGIVEGIEFDGKSNAKRGDIAVMLYNSLDIPMLTIKTYNDGIERDGVEYTVMDGKNGIPLVTMRTIIEKK